MADNKQENLEIKKSKAKEYADNRIHNTKVLDRGLNAYQNIQSAFIAGVEWQEKLTKDSWNREEVIQLFKDFCYYEGINVTTERVNWIKQNL